MVDHRALGVVAANAAEGADVDAVVVDTRLADGTVVVLDAGQLAALIPGVSGRPGGARADSLETQDQVLKSNVYVLPLSRSKILSYKLFSLFP